MRNVAAKYFDRSSVHKQYLSLSIHVALEKGTNYFVIQAISRIIPTFQQRQSKQFLLFSPNFRFSFIFMSVETDEHLHVKYPKHLWSRRSA